MHIPLLYIVTMDTLSRHMGLCEIQLPAFNVKTCTETNKYYSNKNIKEKLQLQRNFNDSVSNKLTISNNT